MVALPARMDRSLPFPVPSWAPAGAEPNPGARSRDPTRIWRCPSLVPPALCPGEAPAARAGATAGVGTDLELWPPNKRHLPFRGPPCCTGSGVGQSRTPNSGGFPLPAIFSLAQRPWSRRGRRVPAGSPGHGAAPAAAQHRGLSLSPRAAGDRRTEPPPDPRVPPCLVFRWQRLRAGGCDGDTAVGGSAPGSLWEWGWGLAWGDLWGRRGPRARRGWAVPCPPALRHRCSPNTPDLKRRFQPGAGGRGPVPPAPVTHPPGAWHPKRVPPRAPHPARMPGGCPPRWGRPGPAAVAAQQSGLVSARPPRRRGQRIPARGPRSGPAALGVPAQPSAIPSLAAGTARHRSPLSLERGPVPERDRLCRVPGWEPGEPRSRKPIGSCWEQPRR